MMRHRRTALPTRRVTNREPNTVVELRNPRRLVRRGVVAGTIAASLTTGVAALATTAGVNLEVGTEAIPVAAFAGWTLLAAAIGVVTAGCCRSRGAFLTVTVLAVALSHIPAVVAPDDMATRAVLVTTHLLAAAIVIPALAGVMTDDATPDIVEAEGDSGAIAVPVAEPIRGPQFGDRNSQP